MNQIPLGVMDEDSGELILCPFCDSPNHCEHLLLLVDDTFLTWIGGYAKDQMSEFTTVIKEHFVARLKDSGGQNISYSCEFLEELWSLVADHGSEGDSIWLDDTAVHQLLYELLEHADAEQYPGGPVVGYESGPGMSSAYTLIHDRCPKTMFSKALSLLKERISGQ